MQVFPVFIEKRDLYLIFNEDLSSLFLLTSDIVYVRYQSFGILICRKKKPPNDCSEAFFRTGL